MQKMMKPALALTLAALLAACGGGGSSDADTGTPAPPPTSDDKPVTSVPAPTYPAGSVELASFNLLNQERGRCGFGLLAQSAQLDLAAQKHGRYMQVNQINSHDEDPAKPEFYGKDPSERAAKAGYVGVAGDANGVNRGRVGNLLEIRGLLAAPYHEVGVLAPYYFDVGLNLFTWDASGRFTGLVVSLGTPKGRVTPKVADVRTYPCDGTTGVMAVGEAEVPSAFPNEASPAWGQPVVVVGAAPLRVTAASITGPRGAVALKAIYGDGQATDPNGYFQGGRAVVIPVPLEPNTVYAVTVAGTNNGQPFTKSFSFQTGG